jgi:hypothetical protein
VKKNERALLKGRLERAERNALNNIKEVRKYLADMEGFIADPTREEHDRAANSVRFMAEAHATCERVSALRLVFNVTADDAPTTKLAPREELTARETQLRDELTTVRLDLAAIDAVALDT